MSIYIPPNALELIDKIIDSVQGLPEQFRDTSIVGDPEYYCFVDGSRSAAVRDLERFVYHWFGISKSVYSKHFFTNDKHERVLVAFVPVSADWRPEDCRKLSDLPDCAGISELPPDLGHALLDLQSELKKLPDISNAGGLDLAIDGMRDARETVREEISRREKIPSTIPEQMERNNETYRWSQDGLTLWARLPEVGILQFDFNAEQADAVSALIKAWEQGEPGLSQEYLLTDVLTTNYSRLLDMWSGEQRKRIKKLITFANKRYRVNLLRG